MSWHNFKSCFPVCIAGSVLGKEAESIKRKAREETKQAQHDEADVRSTKFSFAHRIDCTEGVLLVMLSCLKVKREGQREKGEKREEGATDSSRVFWTESSLSLSLSSLAPSLLQAHKIELVLRCKKRQSSWSCDIELKQK